jgi:hypothetical protein
MKEETLDGLRNLAEAKEQRSIDSPEYNALKRKLLEPGGSSKATPAAPFTLREISACGSANPGRHWKRGWLLSIVRFDRRMMIPMEGKHRAPSRAHSSSSGGKGSWGRMRNCATIKVCNPTPRTQTLNRKP